MIIASLSFALPARSQDAASAKQFVESLYAPYANHGPGLDLSGSKALRYLDVSLKALIDADAKTVGPDEVGVLDGDPICSCQDWDGIWDLKIAIQMPSAGHARAAISFALFAPEAGANRDHRSLEMMLVWERGGWRIDNIVDQSEPGHPFDLRAELDKEIRELQRAKQAKPMQP
jgi:hypothetical protein